LSSEGRKSGEIWNEMSTSYLRSNKKREKEGIIGGVTEKLR
jgi:hypothetical protein